MEQQQPTPELFLVAGNNNADSFVVDDLLDFSNDDGQPDDGFDTFPDSSTLSAANLASDSSNSSSLYADSTGFSDDLCVPVIFHYFFQFTPNKNSPFSTFIC